MSNTLLLISDEHNPFYSSVYGHPSVETPNMANLADQGTAYTAYCPSPLCMPCRSSFMSGRRVHDIQTYSNCAVNVWHDIPSYGRILAEQGVYTVHTGKSHVYCAPEALGFSEVLNVEKFDEVGDSENRRNPLRIRSGAADRAYGFGAGDRTTAGDTRTVDDAVNWLQNTGRQLDRTWTLTVNINNPHFPHYSPQSYWDRYAHSEDLPAFGIQCESANHPRAQDLMDHFETRTFHEDQVEGLRRGYLACVSYVDDQLGRLVAALRNAGVYDETNIITTSDHGEMLGKFGLWWKCSLYEDSVRIPCIAAGPDFSAGERHPAPVDLHDVQASLFHSAGADRPTEWVGQPLQTLSSSDDERVIFSEYHGHGVRASSFMVRTGQWKYIHHVDAPHQLFNIENDPDELVNVLEQQEVIQKQMKNRLRQICDPERENERAEDFINAQQRPPVS